MSEAYDAYLLEWVEEERASLISSLVPSPLLLLKEARWSLPTFLYLQVPARQETAAAPTPITSQLVVSFTVGFPESPRVWGGVGRSGGGDWDACSVTPLCKKYLPGKRTKTLKLA